MELARQRCLLHPLREAVARCPSCRDFYCRECVTEHDHRLLCAACLRKIAASTSSETPRQVFGAAWSVVKFGGAILLVWFAFFLVAQFLARAPTTFHNGEMWTTKP